MTKCFLAFREKRQNTFQPFLAHLISGQFLPALCELRNLSLGISRRTILALPLIGRYGRFALSTPEFAEMIERLINEAIVRSRCEECGSLFLELLPERPEVGRSGTRREQDFTKISVPFENLAPALHEARVVDTPEHMKLLRPYASEEPIQRSVFETRVARTEKRTFGRLAPRNINLLPGQETQPRSDPKLTIWMQERIGRLRRDTVEERMQRAECGALPGFVGPEDHVQAVVSRAQVENTIGEWTERFET
jgi:hypothetical protein